MDWHLSGEPFLTKPGHFTNVVEAAVEQAVGKLPELSTGGGTSDGRFISPAGADVVELGPVGATIHKTNECVRIADIEKLGEIYRLVIQDILG